MRWRVPTLSGVPAWLRWATVASTGALFGMALYVARISEAASYLSDDPATCVNCHVMFPQYASWRHSSHAEAATCNDCHVPQHNVLARYGFKAMDGLRHSAVFTLRREPHVLRAIPASARVIQRNCVRCHTRVVADVTGPHAATDRACIDCHRETPHGRVHSSTSTPNAAVPPLSPPAPEWMMLESRR